MKVPKVPILDINTGQIKKLRNKEKAFPSWIIVRRPSYNERRDIMNDLVADGHDPNNETVWSEVMNNVCDVYYVRAPSINKAEEIIRKDYMAPWSKDEILGGPLKNNPYPEQVHIVQGQERMDAIYRYVL